MAAFLLLEDGTEYSGRAFGAPKSSAGEVGACTVTLWIYFLASCIACTCEYALSISLTPELRIIEPRT